MSFFEARGITAGYAGKAIVKNISFSAEEGSLTGILGANGSGKSTLIRALCGILPHGGRCILNGRDLTGLSARKIARLCSYMGQKSGISIDISLLDVVLMGFNPRLGLLSRPDAAMIREAKAALTRVGLGSRAEENYRTLSEGEKQLCILARTLVSGSSLFLLDEPESALDIRHRSVMLDMVRSFTGPGRCTLLILHDPLLALNGCDRLLLLDHGRITSILDPKTDSLAQMEQSLSHIYGSVTLRRCSDKTGATQLVMLKNREEPL